MVVVWLCVYSYKHDVKDEDDYDYPFPVFWTSMHILVLVQKSNSSQNLWEHSLIAYRAKEKRELLSTVWFVITNFQLVVCVLFQSMTTFIHSSLPCLSQFKWLINIFYCNLYNCIINLTHYRWSRILSVLDMSFVVFSTVCLSTGWKQSQNL